MDYIILGLATFRLSSLLANEPGPFDMFGKLRNAAKGELEKGLGCVWCNSVWVGTLFTVLYLIMPWIVWALLPLALSSIAIITSRVVDG